MPSVETHGLRLHYDTAGAATAPALLLLHGIGSNRRSFRRQLDGLSDGFHVVALDAPGYGLSADPPGGFTLELAADAAALALEELGIEAAHVLGHSMGGVVAQLLYHRHPAKVLSLVLADTTAGGGGLPEPERTERVQRRIKAVETLTPRQLAEQRAPALVSADAPRSLVEEMIDVMAEIRPATYRAAAISLGCSDLSPLLGAMRVPTLVIVGELDSVAPPEVAAQLARAIPGAQLITIRGAGHASNQECPEAFNAAVRAFLERT